MSHIAGLVSIVPSFGHMDGGGTVVSCITLFATRLPLVQRKSWAIHHMRSDLATTQIATIAAGIQPASQPPVHSRRPKSALGTGVTSSTSSISGLSAVLLRKFTPAPNLHRSHETASQMTDLRSLSRVFHCNPGEG